MIQFTKFILILLLLFNCSSASKELKKVSLEDSISGQKTITIKLNQFKDLTTKVIVSLQNIKSFAAENYKYEEEFSYHLSLPSMDILEPLKMW